MRASRMQLKSPSGWYAAGREIEEALFLLSDSAFRLFVWICLRAERSTGSLRVEPAQMAHVLRKSRDDVLRDLQELARLEVCRLTGDRIVVQDRFWPYERVCSEADTASSAYLAALRCAFLRHSCVVSAFTAADEKLARQWQQRAVPVETVERAILLGVARKYTTWLNHGAQTPITSLEYFTAVLSEAEHISAGPDYWAYLTRKVESLESEYRRCQKPEFTETK
jgi:hypothetical protein